MPTLQDLERLTIAAWAITVERHMGQGSGMLSDGIEDSLRRSILLRLAEIVVKTIRPEDGKFDHWFMTAFEGASWVVCVLRLAENTPAGFHALAPASERASRVAGVPDADLPLMEDVIEATIRVYDHFFTIPKGNEWPPDPDLFPVEFDSIFLDLGLQDASGDWTEKALPILMWNDCLTDGALQSSVVKDCISRLAWQALDGLSQQVVEVLAEDTLQGRPGQRLPDYLTQGWRPEGWLSPASRRVARTYMPNPLTRAVAKEIMRLRASAN